MSQFIEMFKEKGYPLRMLKSFADVSTGGTPSKANLEYWNGDKPWVSAEDMKNKYVYDTCEKVTEAGYATCKIIPVDTLMYVCRGSIGVMAINKIECATNQSICRAKCHDNVCNVEFLYHALMYQKDNIKKMGTGTSFKSLNQTSFSELKIELPPYNEQMKFVSIAQQADKSEFVGCKSQFIEMFGNPVTNTKGWKTAKIKDVAPEMPSKEQLSGKIWLLNLDMIESNTGRIIEKVYEDVENALSVQSFDEGNVLFSKLRPYLNKVVIPDEPGMATTELVPLRPEPSKLHKVFLSHLLRGNQFVNYANDIAGGTKMPRMPLTELRNFDCILPPMDKQLEFVFIAEQVDKSEFVGCKSQFIEMFKEKGYPLRMLKSFADVSTGGTPSKANLEYWNGDKPWVSAEDMKNKYVYDTCEKVTEAGYATCKIIPVDTLMYVCRGSIGVMAINKIECATNQSICRAKCHDNVCNVEFLYHALMYQKDNIKKMGTGTSFKSLNQTSFSELKIELPPYNEQMKFVSIAQQADKSEFVGCKSQFIEMFGNPVTNTKGWKTAKIKDVAPEMPSKEQLSGKIWLLNLDMIESNTGRIIEKVYEDVENALSVQSFDEGNVLFSKLRPYLNKVVIPDEPGMATTELVPLRPEPSKLHKVFLSHLLRGNQFVNYANDIAGGTKMPRMPLTELRNFDCILPPMDKQLEFVFIAEQVDKSEYYN